MFKEHSTYIVHWDSSDRLTQDTVSAYGVKQALSRIYLSSQTVHFDVLVAQGFGRWTFDQAVAGLIPGQDAAIKSPRSTQPSIPLG